MGAEVKLGRRGTIDEKLIDMAVAGYSPQEISDRLDGLVAPERVASRVGELLKVTDWLTDIQQEQALLHQLRRNVTEMQEQVHDLDNFKVQLSYIKEIFARLDKRTEATDDQLNTYNKNVGRQLGRVVDMALSYMRGKFSEHISGDDWDAAVMEAMDLARMEISKKEIDT